MRVFYDEEEMADENVGSTWSMEFSVYEDHVDHLCESSLTHRNDEDMAWLPESDTYFDIWIDDIMSEGSEKRSDKSVYSYIQT